MDVDSIIEECGIEISARKIARSISEKSREYILTRDSNLLKELSELIQDRDKVYDFDKEVIKKYLKLNWEE